MTRRSSSSPSPANWKDWLPHRPDAFVEGMDVFRGHVVVAEPREGLRRLRVTDLATNQAHDVTFLDRAYGVFPTQNPEFDTQTFRFSYSSLNTPTSVYDYTMTTKARELKKQQEIPSGFDGTQYEVQRRMAWRASPRLRRRGPPLRDLRRGGDAAVRVRDTVGPRSATRFLQLTVALHPVRRKACVRAKEETMLFTVAKLVTIAFAIVAGAVYPVLAQTTGEATDVYHVHFTKAAPGQAGALGKVLMTPDATAPTPDHFLVLRHQEGDDWDYVVIEHLGKKAAVDAAPLPSNPAQDMRAWHTDTFVSGPPWEEFARAMAIGGSGNTGSLVYIVGVHRPAPGGRDALRKALNPATPAGSKIQTGTAFFQHIEGSDWTFMTLTRYNSWQDVAAERVQAAASPDSAGGWNDIRQHSAFHRDTIASRIAPK